MAYHSPLARIGRDTSGASWADPTCTAAWICKQLGQEGSEAVLVDYLELLIDLRGFPKPLPHRAHGGRIVDGVHFQRSRWVRAGVLQWLNDYLPPAAAAAADKAAEAAAAAEMDRNALRLVGGTAA